MKNIAIIPARGGSKRIPRKNIKQFLGKPIIAYSIEAAIKSELFDEVMVSTDDKEIAEIAVKYGAKVPFMRSSENSNDYATTYDVINEVLYKYGENGINFDYVSCIYSTAPFITPERILEAFEKMKSDNVDSIFTCVQYSYPVQRGLCIKSGKIEMLSPQYKNSRSQDLDAVYHDAGQFYISKAKELLENKSFWSKNTGAVILSELEVQDLDTETDWALAEMKYRLLSNEKDYLQG
ncbi:MAG: pseudaminic acid cytidylyltransferase [Bacteroidales bacterium]